MAEGLALVFMLGAGQGLFLSLLLVTHRDASRDGKAFLALLALVLSAALLDYCLDISGLSSRQTWLRVLLWPKEYFYGPCIYLYVCTLVGRLSGNRARHFGLAALHIALSWPMLLLPPSQQWAVMFSEPLDSEWLTLWSDALVVLDDWLPIVHISAYLALSLRQLKHHRQRVEQQFSYLHNVSLMWLQRLLMGLSGVYALYMLWSLVAALPVLMAWFAWVDYALGLSITLLIYTMGYLALRQPAVFMPPSEERQIDVEINANKSMVLVQSDVEPDSSTDEPVQLTITGSAQGGDNAGKYQNSALPNTVLAAMAQELTELMQREQPYLDPKLSLPQLAQRLSMSTNYLSQLLNEHFKQNFFDYVNRYRVAAALPLLTHSADTVLDIAMAVGFNSKSAFYTAFKKHQQQTPGEYRQQQRQAVP